MEGRGDLEEVMSEEDRLEVKLTTDFGLEGILVGF